MLMPTWDNEWDEKYSEATANMTNRDRDMFAHSLVGAMSPYLNVETTERCLRIATGIHERDLHLVKK